MRNSTDLHLHMGCGESLSGMVCEYLQLLLQRPANQRGSSKRQTNRKKKAVIVRGSF